MQQILMNTSRMVIRVAAISALMKYAFLVMDLAEHVGKVVAIHVLHAHLTRHRMQPHLTGYVEPKQTTTGLPEPTALS